MKQPLYVMVPRLDDTAPIKGAVALCNGLALHFSICLISLKGIVRIPDLHKEIRFVSLHQKRGFHKKYKAIKKLLGSNHEKPQIISFCFSADFMNFFLRSKARIIASLRGNLSTAYRNRYGLAGSLLAWIHYRILHRFDRVLVLSETMKRQVQCLNLKRLSVIGNFVDESFLEHYRQKQPINSDNGSEKIIILVGRLIRGKRPELVIEAVRTLRDYGIKFKLLILGDGLLRKPLEQLVRNYGFENDIKFLGHIENPYDLIQKAQLLVLPSESEGIPRAALEALFFGVPCVLRNVDANAELIHQGVNGYLFDSDQELGPILVDAFLKDSLKSNRCLIPPEFRCQKNMEKMVEILKNETIHQRN